MKGFVVGIVITVVAVAVVAVGVVAMLTGSDRAALVDLREGNCFDLAYDDEATSSDPDAAVALDRVEVVDCAEQHEVEVVRVADLNPEGDRPYPSDAELFDEGDRRCADVAVPAGFGVVPIVPDEVTWDSVDGRMVCVALPFGGGRTTGSVLTASGDDG